MFWYRDPKKCVHTNESKVNKTGRKYEITSQKCLFKGSVDVLLINNMGRDWKYEEVLELTKLEMANIVIFRFEMKKRPPFLVKLGFLSYPKQNYWASKCTYMVSSSFVNFESRMLSSHNSLDAFLSSAAGHKCVTCSHSL